MSIEMIKAIRETEAEAEKIKKKATLDARQILSEANEQAYVLQDREIEKAEQQVKKMMDEAEQEASQEIAKIKSDNQKECNLLKKEANKNIEKAVEIIMGRIVKAHGNR